MEPAFRMRQFDSSVRCGLCVHVGRNVYGDPSGNNRLHLQLDVPKHVVDVGAQKTWCEKGGMASTAVRVDLLRMINHCEHRGDVHN